MKTFLTWKGLLALLATLGVWFGGTRSAPVQQTPVPVYIVGGTIHIIKDKW